MEVTHYVITQLRNATYVMGALSRSENGCLFLRDDGYGLKVVQTFPDFEMVSNFCAAYLMGKIVEAVQQTSPYQTLFPVGHEPSGEEFIAPKMDLGEEEHIDKIGVFFHSPYKVASILNKIILNDGRLTNLSVLSNDQIIDAIRSASSIGRQLELMGYTVLY